MGKFRNQYRPERHYMRGPGPKWHAKHTATLVFAAGALSSNAQPAAKAQYRRSFATWIAPTAAAAILGFVAVMILA